MLTDVSTTWAEAIIRVKDYKSVTSLYTANLAAVTYFHILFHKNDYSDEFIDTNNYKQNKQNDDFELYVTKDHFYKAYGTLPTKTLTDFDKYVTAA